MASDKILTIIEKVNSRLMDDQYTRWPKDELIRYFNDAQQAVVLNRPDSFVENAAIPCVSGTRQTLPDKALRLIDIQYNTATMRALVFRPRDEMNDYDPMWYSTKDEPEAECYFYDERNPKEFFLYPGVANGSSVYGTVSVAPPRRTEAQVLPDTDADLSDIYTNAIVEYMLYLAHSKDFEYSEQQKAVAHMQAYMALLNIKSQSDAGMTPTNKE